MSTEPKDLPGEVHALVELLETPSWMERRRVIAALAAKGDDALPALRAILEGERKDETVLAAAVDALAASNGNADETARELTQNERGSVVCDGAQVLGRRRSKQDVPRIAALLSHADDNVAVAAIEALGSIGDRAAVDALIGAAKSGNFFRQFPAIDALGRLADLNAIEALKHLLSSSALGTEAARALGRFGERAALSPLASMLLSQSEAMVRVAAAAIDELYARYQTRYATTEPLDRLLSSELNDQVVRRLIEASTAADQIELKAIAHLLGIAGGERAIGALTEMFERSGDPDVIRALKRIGRDADEKVLSLFRSGDAAKRVELLPLLRRAALLPELIPCLADQEPALRAATCDTIARIGNPSAAAAIFPLLEDPSLQVMQAATAAIQALGGNETAELAFAAARSPQPHVRRAALGIIGYFLPRGAIDAFLPGLKDPDASVRHAALQGLAALPDPRAIDAIVLMANNEDPRTRASAMRAFAQIEGESRVIDVLERALKDADPWVRYYACQSLGRLSSTRSVQTIAFLLEDDAPQVRLASIEALSHLDSPLALEVLKRAVSSTDGDAKRAALIGLGLRGRRDSLPLLIEAFRSPDATTRLIALSAINELGGDEVVAALLEAAKDPEENIRAAAVDLLAQRSGAAASRALIELLDRPNVAPAVLTALARPAEGRIPLLFAALERSDEDRARQIAAALARMKRPEAIHALFHALGLSNVAARKAAAITLAALGSKEALAAVRHAALEDQDPTVRQLCALLAA